MLDSLLTSLLAEKLGIKTKSGREILMIALSAAKQFDERNKMFMDIPLEKTEKLIKQDLAVHEKSTQGAIKTGDPEVIKFYVNSPYPNNVILNAIAFSMFQYWNWISEMRDYLELSDLQKAFDELSTEVDLDFVDDDDDEVDEDDVEGDEWKKDTDA